MDNLHAEFSTSVCNSGHMMCKRRVSVNNLIHVGEVFWITYSLNSAPVHVYNSGHIMCKRRVSVNNIIGEVYFG